MRFIKLLKNNLLIIDTFIVLLLFGLFYINRTYIDVAFLDGLLPLPMVENYFRDKLSFTDINLNWGEHRLIGYSLIYLINAIVFGLNMKLEPFVFLLSDLLIGFILFFIYKNFLNDSFKRNKKKWMEIFYIPILFLVFSLVHPPSVFMTTQFVIGTIFFVLVSKFFDKLCLDSKKISDLIWFLILIFIYLMIFSGANFSGMILGFVICFLFKIFFSDKRKTTFFCLISILSSIFFVLSYLFLNKIDQDGVGLMGKIFIFFIRFKESFLSLLAGISGATLDIHTFEELFGSRQIFVLINGSVLFLLGIYSLYKYIFLKIYKVTYLPLFLIFYSIGQILSTRLGRLDGGWMWPMNDWYSFHLYFYLIGILLILFYDIFKKYTQSSIKSFKYLFKNYQWTLIVFVFSMVWIFSFQTISNLAQWRRGPHIREWLETKRMALINPTDENLDILLWPKNDSLKAIEILKKYKLSIFRQNGYVDKQNGIIKLSGWYSDGWIGKNARAIIKSGLDGGVLIRLSLPEETFIKIYKNSLMLQILVNDKIIKEQFFLDGFFDTESVDIVFDVPKNQEFNLEIKLNKSFIPKDFGLGKDSRELGIIVNKLEIK